MNIKRVFSIIMCAALLLTALPLSAFAENREPYVEIKFRNTEKYNVAFGETEELYIEYSTGGIENYEIKWDVSKKLRCKIEYIKDENGHITSVKLTGRNFGAFTVTVKILDENGDEIASAKDSIYVVESENKTLEEKFKIFVKDSYIASAMMTLYITIPFVGSVLFAPVLVPYYTYLTVKQIIIEYF